MQEQAIRILDNVAVLLKGGLFSGEMSQAVAEAIQFIENLSANAKAAKDVPSETV